VEYSLTINDTDYIQCTSRCLQITVSFSQPLGFPPECQQNNNIFDSALVCGIEYRINYDTQQVSIDFQASNDTGSLEDQIQSEFLVQTMWLGLSNNIPEPNVITRKYGCNTNNDCARQFYLNSINYFLTEGQTQLDLIKTKLHNDELIVGNKSRRRCIDSDKQSDKPSTRCKFGLCYAYIEDYQLNEQQNSKTQKCDSENRPYLFSEIERHTPKSPQKEREFLKYRCNKNVCNRNDFIEKTRNILNEYTNGFTKPQDNIGKKGNLSIKQTVSSYILVLFLFLIQLFI